MITDMNISHVSHKFYTKTDGDEHSIILHQKNQKSISSTDGMGERRTLDPNEKVVKKKLTSDESDVRETKASETKFTGGYSFNNNYPGDQSGSEQSDNPIFENKISKRQTESLEKDTIQHHTHIEFSEMEFPENKISQISVSKEKVSKKKITIAPSESMETTLKLFTSTPEILNMKSNVIVTQPGTSTKIGLKFSYQNQDEKEYCLYILRDEEPWQKIIIQVKFE